MFVSREELSKNINADEAAAMGAVYQAAALSKAFKVKPFLVRDAAVFPIQVRWRRRHKSNLFNDSANTPEELSEWYPMSFSGGVQP